MQTDELKNLLAIISIHETPFYISRNDFMESGRTLTEALDDLIEADEIDEKIATECLEAGHLWHLTFHPRNRTGFYEYFDSSFSKVMRCLLADLEEYNERINL